jgi:hypothetical protein
MNGNSGNTQSEGTYNELRRALALPPVTSFLELTGGDAELAHQLEVEFEGDVDKVGASTGILSEPKPAGLSAAHFLVFVMCGGPALVQAQHTS